jgi:hypothetical protein
LACSNKFTLNVLTIAVTRPKHPGLEAKSTGGEHCAKHGCPPEVQGMEALVAGNNSTA